ncbi:MAG: tetratricopeptide repeat protein [Hyphomicrobiales bacterium]
MTDESLFREVDEEVRQDEYKKIWDKWGNAIVALAVLVVAAVAAFKGWQYYQQTQSEAAAIVYNEALKKAADGKFEDALSALQAVKHPGYAALARIQEAGVLAQKGDAAKAIAAYDAVAADASVAPQLQDLARINAGYLLADTAKPDELLSRLGRFDRDDQIWRFQAREIFGLAAFHSGDYTMADRYMNALFTDPETPDTMRRRAQMMVQLIAPLLPKT